MKQAAAIFALVASIGGASAAPTAQVVFNFKRSIGQGPYSSLLERGKAYFLSLFSGGHRGCTLFKGFNGPCGTVVRLLPPDSQHTAWRAKDVYRFLPQPDGSFPEDSPIPYDHGNLLLTTNAGGSGGIGALIELLPPTSVGLAWTERLLYSFELDKSYRPLARPHLDGAGNVFVTTVAGGYADNGGVVELSPPSSGQGNWTETDVHLFQGSDGGGPVGGILSDTQGNLYVTTSSGYPAVSGTVVELSPPSSGGTAWTETVLHTFAGAPTDGADASNGLIADTSGNFYGLTQKGGSANVGTVYELSPPSGGGTQWTEQVLYSFTGAADGGAPSRGLARDAAGTLFVTTTTGGDPNCRCGTLVQLTPPQSGQGAYTETTIHTFTGTPDGAQPSEITVEDNGNFLVPTFKGGTDNSGALVEVTNTGFVVK